jgi:hypothetical protein
MALTLSDLTAFTEQYIVERTTDVIFKKSPLFVRLLNRRRMKFEGGTYIQRPIIFSELNGDWFSKGDTFNIAYVTTDTAFTVGMKTTYVNVTLYGIDDILNRGPQAAFSIVESKFANASMKMAKMIATALYQDGQSASVAPPFTGPLSGPKSIDGLLAWIDDGNTSGGYSAATDLTKSFLAVGGINRADLFALAPTFAGPSTPVSAIQGANAFVNRAFSNFTLNDVNTAYGNAWFGNDFPDLIVASQTGWNRMWNATQPNQRYTDQNSDIGKIGFQTFRFNASEVVIDKYMPNDGTNGMMLGLNTNYLELYMSTNKKFQFGFTGFKEAQNSIDIAGQFLYAGNLIAPNPRTSFKLIGSSLL